LSTSLITLESIASIILAVGLVSAYLFSGYLTGTNVSNPPVPQVPQKSIGEGKKKKKKGKGEELRDAKPIQSLRLPGGNDPFAISPTTNDAATEDPALVVASLEAGAAAQEHRGKPKKKQKESKRTTSKAA